MTTHVSLGELADREICSIKGTARRPYALRETAATICARITDIQWILGPRHMVAAQESPRDATAMAFTRALTSAED